MVPISTHSVRSSQDVIGQARGAYYSLTRQGFYGFKAAIEPNWEVILGPTATPENLKVFRAFRFSMTVDSNGAVTVRHEIAGIEKPQSESLVRQIHDDVQRLVGSFFGTWSMFTVNSPFPGPESEIKIENLGKEYRLFYTMPSADAMIRMRSDLLITEWKLNGPRAKRTLKPFFQKAAEGLLLSGYQTVFEPVSEGIKTTLDINIEYQDVNGMKLPHKVRIRGMHGSEPVEAELTFNEYVVNPRPN
jgi:hypothetical protein